MLSLNCDNLMIHQKGAVIHYNLEGSIDWLRGICLFEMLFLLKGIWCS